MMMLEAEIRNLKYKKVVESPLKELGLCSLDEFDLNETPSAFILKVPSEGVLFAVSKWVSPKRTRSYPYARVYDTLFKPVAKTVAIIPVVKDEGKGSNTDYLQWDTVALLSLLNVYVIVAYYSNAKVKKRRKKSGEIIKSLTNQTFDAEFIREKLRELNSYGASALHWNLKELERENLEFVINRAKKVYSDLFKRFGVELPSIKGMDNLLKKLRDGTEAFKNFSRQKAKAAQNREIKTIQPKEALSFLPKVALTIKNYLGGYYQFTVDEFDTERCFLIEAKHTNRAKLPSINDIKDGLLKMMLYTNLENLKYDGKPCNRWKPILKLTSKKLDKNTFGSSEILTIVPPRGKEFFKQLIEEAELNGFDLIVQGVKR